MYYVSVMDGEESSFTENERENEQKKEENFYMNCNYIEVLL